MASNMVYSTDVQGTQSSEKEVEFKKNSETQTLTPTSLPLTCHSADEVQLLMVLVRSLKAEKVVIPFDPEKEAFRRFNIKFNSKQRKQIDTECISE